jgi:hypothetical protein
MNPAPVIFFDRVRPSGEQISMGVPMSGRSSDQGKTLAFFFHAEDPSFWSFASHVRERENMQV